MPPVTYQEYFEGCFPADLAAFLEAMPAGQRKHYAKAPESYSIAMNYLVDPRPALRMIPSERRPLFAASLYFAVLMDQAMYYHHFESYEQYRRLTDYPKLTGACPGACMYLAEPTMALTHTNLFDIDPSDYIQRRPEILSRNELTLAPILKEGTAYFRQAFPTFLERYLPQIAEPEALYRRIFSDWTDAEETPALQTQAKLPQGGFRLAAGWGPVVEVRPERPPGAFAVLSLQDEFNACMELDFEVATGAFAGFRLQRYHKVGKSERPRGLTKVAGVPWLVQAGSAVSYNVAPMVCNKRMTAVGEGDLYLDWSGGRGYDLTSIHPLVGEGVLHFYYRNHALAGLCLERIPITVFNEMPGFKSDGH
jgi:hypothetical protein